MSVLRTCQQLPHVSSRARPTRILVQAEPGRPRNLYLNLYLYTCVRRFTSTTPPLLKPPNPKTQLPPRPTVAEEETFKRYLKGSGPGGQKINKTSSAVQLTHLPTGIVVKSQATRSRTQNENIARRILAEKIEVLEKGSESRVEKKRARDSRRKRSAEKKSRRKYRKLAGDKVEEEETVDHEEEDVTDETDEVTGDEVERETNVIKHEKDGHVVK